jgi:hypothetical protein
VDQAGIIRNNSLKHTFAYGLMWLNYFFRLEQKENEIIIVKIESEKKLNELLKLVDKKERVLDKNQEKIA